MSLSKIANPRIEGTHKPIKIADSFSPLNHNSSEKIKERNAAVSINKSEAVKFLNIKSLFSINITLKTISKRFLELTINSSNKMSNHLFMILNITI